jgi:hypothetical protein
MNPKDDPWRDELNLLDFLERGRDDITSALQNALDAAAPVRGSVFIPPGRWKCGRVRMHPHTAIRGYAQPSWKHPGGSVLELNDPGAAAQIDATGAIGAVVDGICLEGKSLGKDACGILVDKREYGLEEDMTTIERCMIAHFSGDGIRLERIWCYRVRGCQVMGNAGHGLRVRGWDGFVIDSWLSANGGCGFATNEENNASTLTANRIEWNRGDGIHIHMGSHYSITGNYIDRSGGAAIALTADDDGPPGETVGRAGYATVTGNILYRSGKPEYRQACDGPSCHMLLRRQRGVTVTGNTFVIGRDDDNPGSFGHGGKTSWSPHTAMVLEGLTHCVIASNVLDSSATDTLIDDRGGHQGLIRRDNPGSLFSSSGGIA